MKRSLFFLAFTLLVGRGFSQNIDSLAATKQVDSLIQVSRVLTGQGDFDKALEVIALAEKIAVEKLGRESAGYANCAHNHGRTFYFKGEYLESEKWNLEAKAIREKVLGKEHPDYATSLNNLANLYKDMGNNEKAEPLYLEAKAIREKVQGKEHPDYAMSLNNLANLYMNTINYEKAEPLYLEAKTIRENALGKEHPDYAWSLSNLANLYMAKGNYEKAEPFYLEAKAILGNALRKEDPQYALCLHSLANLYWRMADYEKAEPLYLEAKAIREKALGKEHPEYAISLNDLANLYADIGKYQKAEQLYLEAKTTREKALGKEHPEYAVSLNNLAILYWSMADYEKAEPLQLEALSIWEKALGKEHPYYAVSLNNLSNLYFETGNYPRAESLRLEAKAIQEKVLGKEYPEYAGSLSNLATLYMAMGNYEKAEPFYQELTQVNQFLLEKAVRHLSERELGSYLNKFSDSQDHALSFSQLSASKKVEAACFDNALFYKGFLLHAAGQIKRLSLSDSATTEKFNLLKSYERRLAAQYAQPIAERDSADIAALQAKANDLEKDLARTVAGYGQAMRKVNWQEVQTALKPGEAAVEFVHYLFWKKKETDSTMYAALLLLPGAEHPKFIPLFEEKQLVQLLAANTEGQSFAQVYASRGVKPVKAAGKLAGLYDLIWKPLKNHLKGAKIVYYSPSGLLHRINFEAIPVGKKGTLSDQFQLVRLGSTRSLVVPDLTKTDASAEAMLFGGIQYEMDTTRRRDTIAPAVLPVENSPELSFSYAARSLQSRGETWDYLPGTATEVSEIHALFQKSNIAARVFSGENASEEAFKLLAKSKNSPRVLHLATHGFFFPDPKTTDDDQPVFKMSDHPMIRSGLIMAGGNLAWQTGKPLRPSMDDGILTAYEISQMNLSNTELVVLSACETGLGDIQGNEGVYGLQRAFKIAGAKYLIMSLWQVPDRQTSLLMTTFYKKWLTEKMDIPAAFRAAQKELREAGLDPYQWAGFVLVE